jgi:hypothetical protein
MATTPADFRSRELTPEEVRAGMLALPGVVRKLVGECIMVAKYGWACELHPQLCHIPMQVGTAWLDRFIHDSLRQQIVIPGESDFIFEVPGRLEVFFCHERDFHAGGEDKALLRAFLAEPPFCEWQTE